MTKIIDFRVNFKSILGSFWDPFDISCPPAPTCTHTRFLLSMFVPLFGDFVSNWGPHWRPKNQTGSLQVGTELPKTSF